MSKELFVSSTPHETKVAIVEDDQLAEIYFERENEYTLAGSIYKGKVTRVLPGMQSAFVDLGLERDAFLYVTDFLEEQEDQEEFDQVVTQAHERAAKGGAPALDVPLRPIEAEEVLAAEPGNQVERPPRHDGERQPLSNAATIQEAGGDIVRPEVDGNRDDRGRGREGGREGGRWRGRRRRGRRGRGGQDRQGAGRGPEPQGASPENIQESPRGEEPPREAEQPEFRRAVPGEERYERPDFGEPSSERPREEQRTESMDRGAERGPRFDRGDRGGRDRGGRGGRDRGGRDRGGRDRDRGGREAGGREAGGRPANYQPIILPGESISKYRNIQPLPGETLSRPAGTEAQEPRPSAEVLGGESIARYRQEEAQPHRGFAEQPAAVAAQPSADDTQVQTTFTPPLGTNEREQRHERDDERRFEQMNVASVFGGDEATQAPEPSVEDEFPRGRQHEPQAAPPAFGGGVVEEEEIEEEESDALELGEDLDGDFEELEEEELEAEDGEQLINAGAELTDAVREAHVQDRATGHYESNGIENGDSADDEGDDEGTEFEELEGEEGDEEPAEIRADREGEPDDAGDFEESEESSPDRAELRGPSGTAGLQRPERAEREQRRDRFDRGRGGRRGRRGRGRNVRGGGGGRRNIQSAGRPAINELLKEGQEILVQIAKEPMGKKGARITSHIALPGRFLVYMPTVAHIGVSRKIGSDEERQRLKRILLSERDETKAHGGFIVRTAAAGASEDDLRADIRFLVNLWNEIKQRAESGKAPALIYHDLNLVERVLRDQVTQNFTHIWVDNEAEYERVLRFIGRFQPSLVKRVKLYTKDTPLFESFGIQEEINKALKSKVWLKSGGYIVINQTEALVAIDVNTGKYVGKTGRLEDTIVKTNVDAIKEIVRQIRLRDLGGIIVIDFIDMDERRNRQKVMQALEEALRSDRAPSKVLQFNDFGLVAITRKRVKQSLERTLGQPCTYCTGTGLIKSVTTVCNEIYVEMRKMAKAIDKSDVILRVNPEVGKQLKANGARQLSEMEEMTGRTIIVRTDPTLHQEQFDIQ